MGTFDEEEFERREEKISSVDIDTDDRRTVFEGRIEFTGDDSVGDLLSRLKDLKEE